MSCIGDEKTLLTYDEVQKEILEVFEWTSENIEEVQNTPAGEAKLSNFQDHIIKKLLK